MCGKPILEAVTAQVVHKSVQRAGGPNGSAQRSVFEEGRTGSWRQRVVDRVTAHVTRTLGRKVFGSCRPVVTERLEIGKGSDCRFQNGRSLGVDS
jgi:hypothetical protein